jgi:ABC-type transporter Mla subunit MlaD
MLADLEKIITTDLNGREAVGRTQQKALALKRQTDARVRESQEELKEELAQLRQEAQSEILAEAQARVREIGAATERQIQELNENFRARREEAAALLVARVLGT